MWTFADNTRRPINNTVTILDVSFTGNATTCPQTMVYSYNTVSCERTCLSLSNQEPSCRVKFGPVDGCSCAQGTYMNDKGECVLATACPCVHNNEILQPQEIIKKGGISW